MDLSWFTYRGLRNLCRRIGLKPCTGYDKNTLINLLSEYTVPEDQLDYGEVTVHGLRGICKSLGYVGGICDSMSRDQLSYIAEAGGYPVRERRFGKRAVNPEPTLRTTHNQISVERNEIPTLPQNTLPLYPTSPRRSPSPVRLPSPRRSTSPRRSPSPRRSTSPRRSPSPLRLPSPPTQLMGILTLDETTQNLQDSQGLEFSPRWMTMRDAQQGMIRKLRSQKVHPETLPLISDLIQINENGMITVESQPFTRNFGGIQAAFVNGFYPTVLIPTLMQTLNQVEPNFMAGQHNFDQTFRLYNYNSPEDDQYRVGDEYWPNKYYENPRDPGNYTADTNSYSGNLKYSRVFVSDYLEQISDSLRDELGNFSYVEIWSKYYDEPLFPSLVDATSQLKNEALTFFK